MRPQDILKHLRKRPFQPFRLCLCDGSSFEVRHPEMAMVGRSVLTIGIAAPKESEPIYEHQIDCALMHITKLEPLNGRTVSKKNR